LKGKSRGRGDPDTANSSGFGREWRSPRAGGFDHYDGRSWKGFHVILVLAAVASLFVTSIYLRSKNSRPQNAV